MTATSPEQPTPSLTRAVMVVGPLDNHGRWLRSRPQVNTLSCDAHWRIGVIETAYWGSPRRRLAGQGPLAPGFPNIDEGPLPRYTAAAVQRLGDAVQPTIRAALRHIRAKTMNLTIAIAASNGITITASMVCCVAYLYKHRWQHLDARPLVASSSDNHTDDSDVWAPGCLPRNPAGFTSGCRWSESGRVVEAYHTAIRTALRIVSVSLQHHVPRRVFANGGAAIWGEDMVPVFGAGRGRSTRELRVASRRRGCVYRRLRSNGINPDVRIAPSKERAPAVPCVRNSRYLRRRGHVLHARRAWPRFAHGCCPRRGDRSIITARPAEQCTAGASRRRSRLSADVARSGRQTDLACHATVP